MARVGSAAILFLLTSSVNSQFFADFFQGFQPFTTNPQTYGSAYDTTRRDNKNYYRQTTKQEITTKSYDNHFLPQFDDDSDYRKRKTNSSTNSHTTVKPRKKTTRRLINNSKRPNQDNNKDEINTVDDYKPNSRSDNYSTVSGNYYTQKPRGNSRLDYSNNYDNRPDRGYTQKSNNGNIRQGSNGYNKGVKPVVTNGPPITNRPVTRPNFGIDPRPKDDDAIEFPEDDTGPKVIEAGEDFMSEAEKRRYIELAERKCDEYKSLATKAVQAIPLLPSPEPVQISVPKCSPTTVPLVVGGKVVSIQEFPHMALLGWRKIQGAGYSWKCGGSLVSEQFVLTAAHCSFQDRDNTVDNGPPTAVQLGSSYLDDPGALVVKVASVIRHPGYKLPKSYYDLALLKLVHAVKFSEVIKPACLGRAPPVGTSIIATGWGRTQYGGGQSHELRSVSLPIWEMSRCQEVLATSRKLPNGPMSDSQICAGEESGGKDTCQGDSGGPAQIQEDCIWRVVGVTSLGRSCGAAETPGLYAKVQLAFVASHVFGSQNVKNTSNVNSGNNNKYSGNNNGSSGNNVYSSNNNGNSGNNVYSGNNNGNSGNNNVYSSNNNGNSGNSWNNANDGNRYGDSYTERPSFYNNLKPGQDYNRQGSNGIISNQASGNNNQQYGYNRHDNNNYNTQTPYNRPTRYTQKPNISDGIKFNYDNDNSNGQYYYTSTTQKPFIYNNNYDRNNNGYVNNNSQNYGSNNRDQYYNNRPTQRPSYYGGNRQADYENYTVNKPWWVT